ncbi:class II aldolase and adducin N-terminal domain-containing protein [Roseovarius nubinhibens]|uniref:class II aldolase and adducin N-terminal domain-containing protein n=1 Tax=Roseovarius nubinhibens TaxID=314263 RepID=UPI001C08FC5F|nr:class II aldolase and adducin N-terminal domain-containing protein [Roseovarius nubinhibens]MBU3000880.1 class II aldolase and adducin N-terminal domain-containing protein [Roseovarius nubinhibens]|tara:strand:+ start:13127 stop:13897 length:771 start_codon:yes stop_codon:yes gene_type:complete
MNSALTKTEAGCPDAETLQGMREDLAATFRYFARLGMNESVANHFSLAVSPDGRQFLMNPRGRHFSRVRASDLQLIDADDHATMTRENAPDPTAWYIHSRIHRSLPHARCILHLHPRYATALSALADSSLPPIDQNTMRFFGRVAIDEGFEGMGLSEEEGDRLARQMGNKSVLMMGNHGVLIAAPTVAQAMDEMYYFEKACETVLIAYASGRPLRIVPDQVAETTAQQWAEYVQLGIDHLSEVRAILDSEEPDYCC